MKINEVEVRFPENRDELVERAVSQDETCVSVGGLAEKLRTPPVVDVSPETRYSRIETQAFAKLVELWRRKQQLSIAQLAEKAGLSEAEILEAERGERAPEPRVLYSLSKVLDISYQKLLLLTGHLADPDRALTRAAVCFAARSEPMERLRPVEEEALKEFVRSLAD